MMQQRYACSPRETATLNTTQLREHFLIEQLFVSGKVTLVYSHYDRMIVGGVVPGGDSLSLPNPDSLKADYFLERRELGILNIGGAGKVTVDGTVYELGNQDCLYVGKGAQDVQFAGPDAKYYVLSAPAHAVHPTTRRTQAEATPTSVPFTSISTRKASKAANW
jgi:4-deoxy-L-threo-5-hexosulose-uronate ketol-isomerase